MLHQTRRSVAPITGLFIKSSRVGALEKKKKKNLVGVVLVSFTPLHKTRGTAGWLGQINPLAPCNNSKLFGHTTIACHSPCQGLSGSRYYHTFPAEPLHSSQLREPSLCPLWGSAGGGQGSLVITSVKLLERWAEVGPHARSCRLRVNG